MVVRQAWYGIYVHQTLFWLDPRRGKDDISLKMSSHQRGQNGRLRRFFRFTCLAAVPCLLLAYSRLGRKFLPKWMVKKDASSESLALIQRGLEQTREEGHYKHSGQYLLMHLRFLLENLRSQTYDLAFTRILYSRRGQSIFSQLQPWVIEHSNIRKQESQTLVKVLKLLQLELCHGASHPIQRQNV